MQQTKGKYQGYFAWSVTLEGKKNAQNPAPDGEEYYALALFFASSRWGDKEAPFDYGNQAREILSHCIHQAEYVSDGHPMWNTSNYYIKFVVDRQITDPSYHLPHFYEIFAERANEEDREFWKNAASASREFINLTCDKNTGMAPEYTRYDGSPVRLWHDGQFYSDAYRVALNIGLNASWFGDSDDLGKNVDRLQKFFSENTKLGEYKNYLIDGTALEQDAMHPIAIIATLAAGSVAAKGEYRLQWVKDFWNTPLRTGNRRYYDNCLYFFSLLLLSGEYKIY